MSGEASTHATLLCRLSAGDDPGAWGEFCDRYGELIRCFARARGLQPADCDDVLQETLLALTKAMPGFRYEPGKGRFRSYLKTVVLHVIFRKSRQNPGEQALDETGGAAAVAAADPAADAEWEAQWRHHHLRRAMQVIETEFNEKDRRAFDLYAVSGRAAQDTADALGLTVDQVYQAKSRILKRLGEIIERQISEED